MTSSMSDVHTALKKCTYHPSLCLTKSGDAAIYTAFFLLKLNRVKRLLIPKEGGWLTYKTYPLVFDLSIEEVPTNEGIIDLDYLKKVDDTSALILPTLGGYFAEQPLSDIIKICHERNAHVIEDVNTYIPREREQADICVGSFGKWKVVDLGYGGFISFVNPKDKERVRDVTRLMAFDREELTLELLEKLKYAPDRYRKLIALSKKVKEDLKKCDILRRDDRSLVVIVRTKHEDEKREIVKYCEEHGFGYTVCPRYIRTNEQAISIEIKREET